MDTESADGVSLWWSLDGEGPVVVLIPGRGDSSDAYPACLVDQLLADGLSVLRLDPRDAGLSGDGGHRYTLSTMADDVVAVLDAAGVDRAHVVGWSMGGMILLDLASRHGNRVLSATFLAAMSPHPAAGMGPEFFGALNADPVDAGLAAMGSPTGSDRAWLEKEMRRAAIRAPARPEAGDRHQAAAMRFGWPGLDALGAICCPTVIVHGHRDRVLPVAHAVALADGISRSQLHLFDRMGHVPTRDEWRTIGDVIVRHVTARGR